MGNSNGLYFYCINVKNDTSPVSKFRKEHMIRRFKLAAIKKYKFVKAIEYQSSATDFYTDGCEPWYQNQDQWLKDVACYASHLLAIKEFIKSGKNEAVICEDDILFCDDFMDKLNQLKSNLAQDYNLLTLTYMITDPIRTELKDGMFRMPDLDNNPVWGAQAYLITRKYALEVIELYDKPLKEKVTSEIIIRNSKGYIAAEPLVIEDCISSIRAPQDCPFHIKQFCYWDFNKFARSDFDQQSPLQHCNKDMAWPSFYWTFGLEKEPMTDQQIRDQITEIINKFY